MSSLIRFIPLGVFVWLSFASIEQWRAWYNFQQDISHRAMALRCAHAEGQRLAGLANLESALAYLRTENAIDLEFAELRWRELSLAWQGKAMDDCEVLFAPWHPRIYRQNTAGHPSHWPNWHYVLTRMPKGE